MLSDIAGRLCKQKCKNAAGHEYEIQCFVLKIGTSHTVDRAFKKACKTRSLAFKSGLRLMIGPSVHAYFEVTNLFYIQAAFSLN